MNRTVLIVVCCSVLLAGCSLPSGLTGTATPSETTQIETTQTQQPVYTTQTSKTPFTEPRGTYTTDNPTPEDPITATPPTTDQTETEHNTTTTTINAGQPACQGYVDNPYEVASKEVQQRLGKSVDVVRKSERVSCNNMEWMKFHYDIIQEKGGGEVEQIGVVTVISTPDGEEPEVDISFWSGSTNTTSTG